MRIAVTRNTHMVLALAALVATIAAPRVLAADGTLLALEDDWRRVATLTVQDHARSQGIVVPGKNAVFSLVPMAAARSAPHRPAMGRTCCTSHVRRIA